MLIYKTALVAGALAISGAGAMAQGTDLGARAIVIDNYNNQRALQEQAEYRASESRVRSQRPDAEFRSSRITQRDAVNIARTQGVDDIESVRRRQGMWMIDGTDPRGEEVIVRVNSRGEVLDVWRQ
jgi:hypothetical protein